MHIPEETDCEEEQVADEIFEIVQCHAVGDPRAVMVESRHAFVACGTMLGTQWSSNQARETKVVQLYLAACERVETL